MYADTNDGRSEKRGRKTISIGILEWEESMELEVGGGRYIVDIASEKRVESWEGTYHLGGNIGRARRGGECV